MSLTNVDTFKTVLRQMNSLYIQQDNVPFIPWGIKKCFCPFLMITSQDFIAKTLITHWLELCSLLQISNDDDRNNVFGLLPSDNDENYTNFTDTTAVS